MPHLFLSFAVFFLIRFSKKLDMTYKIIEATVIKTEIAGFDLQHLMADGTVDRAIFFCPHNQLGKTL